MKTSMRVTVTIDDDLLAEAQEYLGAKEKSAVVSAALTALIRRRAAEDLIALGGSDPKAELPRRRRPFD
jgi:Arc/MetJ family transcription regulator